MALESNPNVVSLNAVSLPWRYAMVRARINYVPYRSEVARYTQKCLFICERGDRSATLGVRGSWNHFVAASSFSSRRNGLLVFLADRGRTRPETEKQADSNKLEGVQREEEGTATTILKGPGSTRELRGRGHERAAAKEKLCSEEKG